MSFYDTSLKQSVAGTGLKGHLRKDVGAAEAFNAQRLNTYGIAEEGAIVAREKREIGQWVREMSGDRFTSQAARYETPELYNDPFKAMKQLEAEGQEVPEKFRHATFEDFKAAAIDREAVRYKERQGTLSRATGIGKAGSFAGGLVGAFDDPENIVTLPLGAAGRAGIAMTALAEGAVGAGMEGLTHYPREELLNKMGVESDATLLGSMATGFLGGAILGGTLRTLTGPEIYRAAGNAINKLGLRGTSRRLQKSDKPTAQIMGHAIEEELNYREAFKARSKPLTDSEDLRLDAEFLRGYGNFDEQADKVRLSLDNGTLEVPIRLSDDSIIEVEAAETVVRASRLVERYDLGEAIPADELDELGIDARMNNITRRTVEYFDAMDARFQGKTIPDDFDILEDGTSTRLDAPTRADDDIEIPLDEADEVKSVIDQRKARAKELDKKIKAAEASRGTPDDFGGNLTRTARQDENASRQADDLEAERQDNYEGIIRDVERVAIGTKDGKLDAVEVEKIIQDIADDEEFAEIVKLCGLQ